jgi:hypothetical protein
MVRLDPRLKQPIELAQLDLDQQGPNFGSHPAGNQSLLDLIKDGENLKNSPACTSRYLSGTVLAIKQQGIIDERYSPRFQKHGEVKAHVLIGVHSFLKTDAMLLKERPLIQLCPCNGF